MRKAIFLILFLFCTQSLSQSVDRDSMIASLPRLESDEEKLKTIILIAHWSSDIDDFYSWKEQAVGLIKKTGNKKAELELMLAEGRVHLNTQQDEKGMQILQDALAEAEAQQDSVMISRINYQMGVYHFWHEELDYAIKYIKLSIETFPTDGDQITKATNLMALGVILQGQHKYEESLMYHQQALEIKERENAWDVIPISLNNLAELHNDMGNTLKAIELTEKSISIADTTGDDPGLYYAMFIQGIFYEKLEQYDKAVPLIEEAVEYWERIKSGKDLPRAYQVLTDAYKKAGHPEKAFFVLEKYVAIKDSLFKGDQQAAAKDIAAKYETEKNELLLEQEKKDKEFAQKESEMIKSAARQRLIIFSVIGVLLLLNIGYFYKRYKDQRKVKEVIEQQKKQIEERSKEIMDSIVYAKRIQSAILPRESQIKKYLPESFVLYKPKDVVAGDFYWLETVNGSVPSGESNRDVTVLFAAADCTGHGVPGAMVSVVCNNGLNLAVRQHQLTDPAQILDKTREIIIEEFEKSDEDLKDGMDIALVALQTNLRLDEPDKEEFNAMLKFAGAHNPLWIIRGTELLEFKGNKQPIGKFHQSQPFTTHTVPLKKNDLVYVFTDGFADQFGGEKGKKLKASNFKQLLLSIAHLSMAEQMKKIDETFENWKRGFEQLDDVCVIGVRI